MADFGLGFLYVREELLNKVAKRTHFDYHSAPDTLGALAALGASLPYPRELGADNIQTWRKPLLERLAFDPLEAIDDAPLNLRPPNRSAASRQRARLLLARDTGVGIIPEWGISPSTPTPFPAGRAASRDVQR